MKVLVASGLLLIVVLFVAAVGGGGVSMFPPQAIDVRQYGARCDGVTDDAAALQTAFNAGSGKLILLPAGTCNFSSKLTLLGTGTALRGAGRSTTVLRSTFATGDELYVGDTAVCPVNSTCPTVATYNYHLSDFTIFSSVTRSSGYTIDLHNADAVFIDNVENNNDLLNALSGGNVHFKGIFSDHAGATHIDHSEFRAQGDVWTITQSTDSSMHGTNLRAGTVGLRLAGGASGFHCTQSNLVENTNNLLIDNSIATTVANAAGTFGSACYLDSASGDNVVINTALGGINVFQFSGTTIETQNGAAVHIISAPNLSYLVFDNVAIGSYSGVGTGHGILQDDCTTKISITGGSKIWFNSGYGIDQTCSPANPNPIYIAADTYFASNTLGSASFGLSTLTGGANVLTLQSSGVLSFDVNGSNLVWQIETDGRIFAGTDNTYDFGDTAANRARNIYAGTSVVAPAIMSSGAAPTPTGTCTAPTMAGGNTAGTMTTATGCGGTTIILTFAKTATTGWACTTTNRTVSTRVMPQTGSSTTTATFTGTTNNGDVLGYSCVAY